MYITFLGDLYHIHDNRIVLQYCCKTILFGMWKKDYHGGKLHTIVFRR